jgi:hypothetical protein
MSPASRFQGATSIHYVQELPEVQLEAYWEKVLCLDPKCHEVRRRGEETGGAPGIANMIHHSLENLLPDPEVTGDETPSRPINWQDFSAWWQC